MANGYGISDIIFGDKGFYKSDPVGSFNFILTVEGIYDIPLKGVRAFQKVNQFEKIREGGVNDYVHMKRAPIQDAHTIQFERYVSGTLFDPLANGAELAIPVILWLKRAANNGLTDAIAADKKQDYTDDDYDTSSVRLYVFTGCVVVSKEYGALDAEHSGLATEVVTMAYKELYIVPNLYTFFGGGTDVKSWGQGGELTIVDEEARKKFKEQQEKDYKAAIEARAQKAAEEKAAADEAAAKADQEATRKGIEDQEKAKAAKAAEAATAASKAAAKAAEEAKQKAAKAAEEVVAKEKAAFKEKQEKEHKAAEEANKQAAKAADEKSAKERAEFKEKQEKEHKAAEEANKQAAKAAEEKNAKEKKEAAEYQAAASKKGQKEKAGLEKANAVRNRKKK